MSRYLDFKKSFEKAVSDANRSIGEVELIAVSKKKPKEDIQNVINHHQRSFGENQIQEVEEKWPVLKEENSNIKLHYIGNIQSRKVSSIFNICDVIHSLDRIKIVKLFNDLEQSLKIKKEYFIQINTGNEEQKSGVYLSDARNFIRNCLDNYDLNVKGLMCLPPINENPEPHFLKLKELGEIYGLTKLSMGMSNDYKVAIKCGATHIRIGTQIFGKRN